MTDTTATGTLVCPKCHGRMRAYERNGVTIDQCTECRGIFLDRGELERLIDAETTHYRPQAPEHGYRGHDDDDDDDDEREHRDWKHGRPRKRRSFMEGMFGD